MTRKLLMICYFFPPTRAVGTIRSVGFSKLLPEFGWKPVVLSVKKAQENWLHSDAPVPADVEVEYSTELPFPRLLDFLHACSLRICKLVGIHLKRNNFRHYLAIPDTQLFWMYWFKGLQRASSSDAIYVSCSPNSAAISAALIAWIKNKPLVVDYRDAWSFNPYNKHSGIVFVINRAMETFVLNRAAKIILNTDGAATLCRRHFPKSADKFICIPNGYDAVPQYNFRAPEQFTILHLGSFYTSRKPDLLLRALRELPELNIRFIQVGGTFNSYPEFADMPNLTVIDSVKQEETIEFIEQASLLYLKQGWEQGISDYIMVAAKTYEYILSGIPVLLEAPPGDNADLVDRYVTKKYMVTEEDNLELMKTRLREAYADWEKAKSGATQYTRNVDKEFLEKFDRRNLTKLLAKSLDECVGEPIARRQN